MNLQLNSLIGLCCVPSFVLCIGSISQAQSNEKGQSSAFQREDVHAKRDRLFIETTATRDFDQLIEAISKHDGENGALARASAMQGSFIGSGSVPFRAVLADRRVAKLHELLAAMPRAEASHRISRAFADKCNLYSAEWDKALEENTGIVFSEPQQGMNAALFLCLEFCDDVEFDRLLQQWAGWCKSNVKCRQVEEHRSAGLPPGPDEQMIINLYAVALHKKGIALEDLNLQVRQLCDEAGIGRLPDLEMRPFYKWNTVGQMRNDPANVLAEYPVFHNWGEAIERTLGDSATYPIRMNAMAKAREWVHPPSPLSQWLQSGWQRLVEWVAAWFRLDQ